MNDIKGVLARIEQIESEAKILRERLDNAKNDIITKAQFHWLELDKLEVAAKELGFKLSDAIGLVANVTKGAVSIQQTQTIPEPSPSATTDGGDTPTSDPPSPVAVTNSGPPFNRKVLYTLVASGIMSPASAINYASLTDKVEAMWGTVDRSEHPKGGIRVHAAIRQAVERYAQKRLVRVTHIDRRALVFALPKAKEYLKQRNVVPPAKPVVESAPSTRAPKNKVPMRTIQILRAIHAGHNDIDTIARVVYGTNEFVHRNRTGAMLAMLVSSNKAKSTLLERPDQPPKIIYEVTEKGKPYLQ